MTALWKHPELSKIRFRDVNSNDWLLLNELQGKKGTLYILLSNQCPLVHHAFPEILRIISDYRVLGISFIGINILGESLDESIEFGFENAMPIPYLHDPQQIIAKALENPTCPDFYLYQPNGTLFYHGRLDDSLPGNGYASGGFDLRVALDRLLQDRLPIQDSKASAQCKTHWQAETAF